MRVLQVIDSLDRSGGAEQAIAAAATAIVRRGVDLEVAYLVDRAGLQDDLRTAGVIIHAVGAHSRWSRIGAIAQLISVRSPDLVHTTLLESDLVGRLAAFRKRTPVVSSLVNVAYGPEHRGDPRLSSLKVRAVHAADLVTARVVRRFHAISRHVATTMARRLLIPADRIDVVPRGRDPKALLTRTPDNRRDRRIALGVGDHVPLVLAAARHEHQKGLDVLVRAMALVQRHVPGAALLVAGRFGGQTRLLEATAERVGADRVCLLGPRDDVPALMGAADVFCAPSRWEGLGSAVIEAMGVGVPIVASDVPAIREAVGSDACANLVPPEDPPALAAALAQTFSDAGTAEARTVAARARFTERYALEAVVDGMVAFYKRATGDPSASRSFDGG